MREKKLYQIKDRAGNVVATTMAVSEKQAVNNARHRLVGDFYGHQHDYSAWPVDVK